MTLGFYHVGDSPPHERMASLLIASARAAMPRVPIVHLTDETSRAIAGADTVVRRPVRPIALGCLEHYAACVGDWLLVDSDVVVQEDVRHIFDDQAFDVAVADRAGTFKPGEAGTKFMARMPYNKGAVFSRCPAFWAAAADWLATKKPTLQNWMGDQRGMCEIIATRSFRLKVLTNRYNYPPVSKTEDVSDKAILHLKGSRKAWADRFAACLV